MQILLDNGTDIEINENMISITNGFRGFTWDLKTNELHRATDTVTVEEPDNDLKALCTKLLQAMDWHLEHINGCVNNNKSSTCDTFKGLLNDDDLKVTDHNFYSKDLRLLIADKKQEAKKIKEELAHLKELKIQRGY